MKYLVSIGEEKLELDVERSPDGSYRVRDSNGSELEVRSILGAHQPRVLSLSIDGQLVEVQPGDDEVRFQHERFAVRAESLRDRAAARSTSNSSEGQARKLLASMPGRIVNVLCEVGSAVRHGAPLIVIEAMKMQNELCAKTDAVVSAIHVSTGQTVDRGAVLVEFE
jgi:biotin carboxyl carrier protein